MSPATLRKTMLMSTVAACLLGATAFAPAPAFAACVDDSHASISILEGEQGTTSMDVAPPASGEQAEAVVDEMVAEAEPANDGSGEIHPATGPAEPRENWFGCGPDTEEGACEDMTPDTAPEAAAGETDRVGDAATAADECASRG